MSDKLQFVVVVAKTRFESNRQTEVLSDSGDRSPTDERAITKSHETTRRRIGSLAFSPKRSFLERQEMKRRKD